MEITEYMRAHGATFEELRQMEDLLGKYFPGDSFEALNTSERAKLYNLSKLKKDICKTLEISPESYDDGIVGVLKSRENQRKLDAQFKCDLGIFIGEHEQLECWTCEEIMEQVNNVYAKVSDLRQFKDILDEIKKYFKMTAFHWKYSDIPHFVKTAHEFALEKKEEAEDALREFIEDICKALGVNLQMSTKSSVLSEIKRLRECANKQEDFTEEAADILGVHPGDLSLSDILDALRKLKREEKLDEMNCEIIANLREERDQSQRAFSGEHSRRLAAEKYISDTFQRAAKELGMTRIPDSIDALCDEIADLRNYRNRISCPKDFWEAMCDIMEMDPTEATPSDVIAKTKEAKQRLISVLALNPDATWTDIYDAIKAEQKDHCDLISESYKMRNELSDTKDILSGLSNTCTSLKNERDEALHKLKRCEKLNNMNSGIIADLKTERDNLQRYISDRLSKICSALGIEYSTDTTLEYILDTIDDLKSKEGTYCHQSFVFSSVCDYLGIAADDATLSDIRKEIEKLKSWKTVAADHDKRRKNWIRKYKSEHERANSCDELYREWKDKYEAYYEKTSNIAEQNESLMASYMAVKNTAIKQKDILKVVCRYLAGKDTLPDKDIVVRLNEMWTKENGWDGLVEHYGAKVIRELVDACDDEITETTRKDLGDMLST